MACGVLGPLMLAAYFTAPLLASQLSGVLYAAHPTTVQIVDAGRRYHELLNAGTWLQATGALLAVVFFLALADITGHGRSLASKITQVGSAVLLAVVLAEAVFTPDLGQHRRQWPGRQLPCQLRSDVDIHPGLPHRPCTGALPIGRLAAARIDSLAAGVRPARPRAGRGVRAHRDHRRIRASRQRRHRRTIRRASLVDHRCGYHPARQDWTRPRAKGATADTNPRQNVRWRTVERRSSNPVISAREPMR